jgi:hypothetical protein
VSKELKFPRDYDPKKPTNEYLGHELVASKIRQDKLANFFAPKYAVDLARQLIVERLNGQPFITLSIREIERDDVNKTRRINQNIWQSAITALEEQGIKTLIFRDTDKAFKKPLFDGAEETSVGSIHLHLRMALGHLSSCNFSKNNGPGILNLLSSNGGVYFNEFDENVIALSKNWYEINLGMSEGSQYPMSGKNNLFEWGKEDKELIIEHTLRSQSNKGKHIPDHTYFDKQNFLFSVQVGLRYLIRCLNHGILKEDLDFFFKLEQMNKSVNFTDSLIELIAEQRKGSLKSEAFDVFEELVRKNRPA